MKVISLFDGISCGKQALKELGIPNDYYASEINRQAIAVASANHPDITQFGDVRFSSTENFSNVDLLIGGSPCTSFSIGAHTKESGLIHGESVLFWQYYRFFLEVSPKYFLLENVVMKKRDSEEITRLLGVEPVLINSGKFTAQQRNRLYWTNIPFEKLDDTLCDLTVSDIMEDTIEKPQQYTVKKTLGNWDSRYEKMTKPNKIALVLSKDSQGSRVYSPYGKSVTLVANGGGMGALSGLYLTPDELHGRRLTPLECERLQGLPDNYTNVAEVSPEQRRRLVGNGWSIPVIKHILGGLSG